MASPFQRQPRQTLAQRVKSMWERSDVDLEREVGDIEQARRVLDWMEQPYHMDFIGWLRQEADRPLGLDVHGKMIVAATRSNTLREILQRLERVERKARSILDG